MYWETDTPAHCAGLARRRQAPFAGAAVEFCVNVPFGGRADKTLSFSVRRRKIRGQLERKRESTRNTIF